MKLNPNVAAILGALIADSAALGLHWLYDPVRIAKKAETDGLVFISPNRNDYADTKGFFAHSGKVAGDASGYGEIGLLMLNHIAKHGEFNRVKYQSEFCAHFGPGGGYVGYIDSPTRLTLRTLLPLAPEDYPVASGADDDQFAALATVPVLVATHTGDQESLIQRIEQVVRITNNNDVAVAAAKCSAILLLEILKGKSMEQAITDSLPFAGKILRPLIEQALTVETLDSVAVSERFGSACHVAEGLPVVFHIARCAPDYRTAIEANIRAGGDSCGRGIILGAVVAAYKAKQNDLESSIPLVWMARYRKLAIAADACSVI
ncbi:MAG: ADP-ribosylglycohydrolase family protein [Nitrosomonas sp.]|nr:ADP-ribosylglycohydrolase family protein [Nitrosomonas sp.]